MQDTDAVGRLVVGVARPPGILTETGPSFIGGVHIQLDDPAGGADVSRTNDRRTDLQPDLSVRPDPRHGRVVLKQVVGIEHHAGHGHAVRRSVLCWDERFQLPVDGRLLLDVPFEEDEAAERPVADDSAVAVVVYVLPSAVRRELGYEMLLQADGYHRPVAAPLGLPDVRLREHVALT